MESLVLVKYIFRGRENQYHLYALSNMHCICISVRHQLILIEFEEKNFPPFSKQIDCYKVLVAFETTSLFKYFVFAHF